jgi:dienelactone hydrolase
MLPLLALTLAAAPTLTVVTEQSRGALTLREVRFDSPTRAKPITGVLVVPAGAGPFAAVLFAHWLGDPPTSNHTEFLDDAVELGERGVLSLLIDSPWSDPEWFEHGRSPKTDLAESQAQVKDFQRAMDVLLAQPGVDLKRVGFVGHDFGAMYGVLMGSAQPRAKTWVLLAPTATFSEWFLLGEKPADPKAFVKSLAPLDLARHLPKLKGSVLFQFAKTDRYVSPEVVKALVAATPQTHEVKLYEHAGHDLKVPEAHDDRLRWLVQALHPTP